MDKPIDNPLNESNIKVPYLRNLAQSLNAFMQQGFEMNFKAVKEGLLCVETERVFRPDELLVVNFYRFEGVSDPADNTILYLIESKDGTKGTLVDAYGAYADPLVSAFMENVKIEERV